MDDLSALPIVKKNSLFSSGQKRIVITIHFHFNDKILRFFEKKTFFSESHCGT